MLNKVNRKTILLSILIVAFLMVGAVIPSVQADSLKEYRGFDKGPSYKPVVPIKKTTFVNFDKDSLLDDYAYLSAVPTAVFTEGDKIISHPLLYYQDKFDYKEDKERIFNAYDGIKYFMEDWKSYSNGNLDQMTLINVDRNRLNPDWKAKDYVTINGDDPYSIANALALQDWSYSDEAVVAVIGDDFKNPEIQSSGSIEGTIPSGSKTDTLNFQMDKPEIGVGANYHYFDIADQYKYVVVNMYWKNKAVDLDLQLYDDKGVMADASSKWNILYGAGEDAGSYVYSNDKPWSVGVTYMPTQAGSDGTEDIDALQPVGKMSPANPNMKTMGLFGGDKQDVDVFLYPGFEYEVKDPIPYGCKNAKFTLKWNNPNIHLGFVLLDPSGVETATVPSSGEIIDRVVNNIDESDETELTVNVERLGETQGDGRYKICVFSLDDITTNIDFTLDYSWQQNMTREEGDCLASATEGAVLGSVINSPLLYVEKDDVTDETIDTLYKLGVEKIYLINLGDYLSNDVKDELKSVCDVKEFTEYKEIYDKIKGITERQDVIFTTVDPWTYYYADQEVPVGEYWGARFVGPAAYIAAHHGAPVLIIDNHPELSQAVVWHTQFWRETANDQFRPHLPSVSIMVQTGMNVMKFLEDYGYVLPEKGEHDNFDLETMITVADHFDIGPTWDRTFTGRLIPGRFSASPVDLSYWISRSTFYPALIFENPALKQDTVTLENGSKSKVVPYLGKLLYPRGTDLVIYEDQQKNEYKYPILHTYNVYLYKFNEVGSKHWGGYYTTANGIIPYITPSTGPDNAIDLGIVPDKVGAFHPDIDETDVTPIYAQKAGYSNCFSTNFDVAVENLNQGVIMWMESCHGSNGNYGTLSFWNPDSPYIHEPNPWRAYERPMLSPSGWKEAFEYMPEMLDEFGLPSFNLLFKLTSKLFIPVNLVTVDYGSTDDPDQTVMNPDFPILLLNDAFRTDFNIKDSKGLSLIPILGRLFRTYGGDGVVIDPSIPGEIHLTPKNGIEVDGKLGNMHSCGLNAVSCLVAHTYMHTVFIRHGAPYQIMDPWSTSWYSGIWSHSIPRQLALGYTMGQTYEYGMSEVGVEYLTGQYWWDLNENVLFYGDPDIRVWTPENKWDPSNSNHWEKKDTTAMPADIEPNINGHTPFGAKDYPNKKEPQPLIPTWIIIVIVLLLILIILAVAIGRKKQK